MSLSHKVATLYEVDGREFVDVNDFLGCYPNADEKAKQRIKSHLKAFSGDVEKRVEGPLVNRLINTCWNADPMIGALNSPIVLRDGWVVWVDWGHDYLIDSFGLLFEKRDKPEMNLDDMLAILSDKLQQEPDKPNSDLIMHGHAWYISTREPRIIWIGKTYRPTRDDLPIFGKFQVRCIDD